MSILQMSLRIRSAIALMTFVPSVSNAQVCGTAPPSQAHFERVRDVIAQYDITALRNAGTTCIPMQAHVVRMNDGTGGISLQELNIGLSYLNAFFLDAGIEFFWKGFPNVADNTDLYAFNATSPDNDTEAALAALFTTATNAVNIYFVNSIVTSSGTAAAGYAYFPNNSVTSNRIVMTRSSTTSAPNGTFLHEFGHYFDLFHTHEGTEFGNADPNAENVPRTGVNANCGTKGDLLCGTEADPRYASAQFNSGTCTYTGGGTDINGAVYTPPVENVMSYFPDQCGGLFTTDQYTRISQGLIERQGHSAYSFAAGPMTVPVPTALQAVLNGPVIELTWNDNAANEMGYLIERSTTSSTSGFRAIVGGGTAPDAEAWTDADIASNTTYWYRVKSSNGDCNAYSNVVMLAVGLVYCIPEYFETCAGGTNVIIDEFILVGATTLTNSNSNCSPGGLGDFTAMAANVVAVNSYNVTVNALVGSGSYFASKAQIWIDLDQNGSFDDPGEKMLATAGSMAPSFTASITIPATALNGSTRMRVRCWDDFNGCNPSSCSFCAFGETEDYTVNISGGVSPGKKVSPRIYLEGPYVSGTGLMGDQLRVAGSIPLLEPYTALGHAFVGGGGETIAPGVLSVSGGNAIVDWVIVELRNKNNSSQVLASRSALLQRDGDVVDLDGSSAVLFAGAGDNFHVAVRHRNHLGVMSLGTIALGPNTTVVDLTLPGIATYGSAARKNVGGAMCLWAGNVVSDNAIKYTGSNNDRDPVLNALGGSVPTNTINGYRVEDVNLDGTVKYTGAANDRDIILTNVGGAVPTNTRLQQLP